jgi:hypothetical protein
MFVRERCPCASCASPLFDSSIISSFLLISSHLDRSIV